ncbi:MAG: glycosyltransferase family 2 protein [Bacteroidia bacterium]|nr:glycosyltransferase family 2 protein [Bacteroidia bacterium]
MNNVLFSIIIPTYNRADFIIKTLDSFIAQTYHNYEIIVVDDGSTDNTAEVIVPYLSNKIAYYKKVNEERAAARNYGALKAKGHYINFFDSDDLALDNHLQEASNVILKKPDCKVFHLNYEVREFNGDFVSSGLSIKDINRQIIEGNPFSCNGVFIARDVALSNPFNQTLTLSASEDYELWIRLNAQYKFICSDVITSVVVQHDNRSVTAMKDPFKLINRFCSFIDISSTNEHSLKFLVDRIGYFKMRNYLLLSSELAYNKFKILAITYLLKACLSNLGFFTSRSFYATIKHLILPK